MFFVFMYYNYFRDMLSSLKSYHIFVVKQHVGSIVVSLIWKRRWPFFKQSWLCVYMYMLLVAALPCMIKVWQCVNWKYFSNSY